MAVESNLQNNNAHSVSLRKIPYPYKAMLAICSDLDLTPDRHVYFEIMKFLNTTEKTKMGPGVGLEVGNTIYFDMPKDQFSYWNTDDAGRSMIRECIQSGHIDCLHSFGDLATTRSHAERALNELEKHNCKLKVWIDHATAPSNFGSDIMKGFGDVVGSKAYHADLTLGCGIKYVWLGRVTSIIGQNNIRKLNGIIKASKPIMSGRTWLKELSKGILGRYGNQKYAMHWPNDVLKERKIRDGSIVFEFIRSNPHYRGTSFGETADGLPQVVTSKFLDTLVEKGGICILYTHLGKMSYYERLFSKETKNKLSLLAKYKNNKKILVTTTRRILDYCNSLKEITIKCEIYEDHYCLNISTNLNEDSLQGITIYIPDKNNLHITINGKEIKKFVLNSKDQNNKYSISIPYRSLKYPI